MYSFHALSSASVDRRLSGSGPPEPPPQPPIEVRTDAVRAQSIGGPVSSVMAVAGPPSTIECALVVGPARTVVFDPPAPGGRDGADVQPEPPESSRPPDSSGLPPSFSGEPVDPGSPIPLTSHSHRGEPCPPCGSPLLPIPTPAAVLYGEGRVGMTRPDPCGGRGPEPGGSISCALPPRAGDRPLELGSPTSRLPGTSLLGRGRPLGDRGPARGRDHVGSLPCDRPLPLGSSYPLGLRPTGATRPPTEPRAAATPARERDVDTLSRLLCEEGEGGVAFSVRGCAVIDLRAIGRVTHVGSGEGAPPAWRRPLRWLGARLQGHAA